MLRFIGLIHCISSKCAKHPGCYVYNINSIGYVRMEVLGVFNGRRELEKIRNIRVRYSF